MEEGMTKRLFASMCLVWVMVLWGSLASAHAATQTGYAPGDCIADADIPSDRTYECGVVTVPLYADNRTPGVVELPVMIIRSETPNSNLPLYLLQGGPGGDTIDTFSYTITKKDSVLPRDRDLVFFEQRGTTLSKPSLNCPEIHENDIAQLDKDLSYRESNALYLKAWRACLARLNDAGVDVGAFNSLANADDVAAIATLFGHTQIDLYGVSYGSLLAQHVVERHPSLVRAVILDGVVPKDREPNYEYAVSKTDAFQHMFDDCAADPACNAHYPNLQQTYVALYNALEANPITVDLVDSDTETTHAALIDGESFEGLVFNLHYDSELVTYLPMFITQVANQEYEVFKVLASFTVFQDSISEGMYNATMCSEEIIPQPDEILIPRNPIVPVDAEMVASDIQWYTETCAAAAVPALDANVNKAFTTDTPTLLLSGRYDPITPASMGDTVVAGLANATHVVLPNAAHGAFVDNTCAVQITNQFLTDPRATLDTACVAAQQVAFATPDTVMETPFIIQLISLNESVYMPLAAMGACLVVMLIAAVLRPLAWALRVIQQKPQPDAAVRTLFGVQWLMIISTIGWLGYVVYVCFDLVNPDGNYGYHSFFGVPTSYQLATTAYAYMAAIILGGALSAGAIRSQPASRWPIIATSFLLLTGVVLVIVMWAIGFIGG
jgi:pimeloyl-ACP methyl ester carboxylesterase